MSSANAYLTVADFGVDVIRKDIKNLHISVYPPVGRVRVAAPERMDDDSIRRAVVQRLPWIKRQREQLLSADRQTEREMVSGETHYIWGQRYRLDVSRMSRNHHVDRSASTLWVIASPGASAEERYGVLDRWYRREMKIALPPLLEKWQAILGVQAPRFVVRRMKTKWGTCKPESAMVTFNSELAKKNPWCLEYIVVHELAHLRERGHGEAFVALMDVSMPDWRARWDELNVAPLAHEEWGQGGS
jgi:predicted metal-dependent hydrolase